MLHHQESNPQMQYSPIAAQEHSHQCHYTYGPDIGQNFTDAALPRPLIFHQSPNNVVDPTSYPNYYSDSSSPTSSLPPSPLFDSNPPLPSPSSEKPPPRLRSGNRVPRPRNAFMIYRSEFWVKSQISKTVEHDHRHISRIIGHCWNQLPEDQKDYWRGRAEKEKLDHAIKYPGYRFSPNVRTKQVIKRNVKRNGEDEMLRCKKVAELLLAGKAGQDLDSAVETIDKSMGRDPPPVKAKKKLEIIPSQAAENLAFRSPLLPPTEGGRQVPVPSHTQPQYSNAINYSPQQPGAYEQGWSTSYNLSPVEQQQMPYPTQQYIPDARNIAPLTSSPQDYHNAVSYGTPSEVHHGSHSVNLGTYPSGGISAIDYANPFYDARNPSSAAQVQVIGAPVDAVPWISSHPGH
ncbi:hypothetical protein H0H93_013077 [Arthromyces matolae]|nr:hypothetical protein H0H93_013077 [Arthromyces matolae]